MVVGGGGGGGGVVEKINEYIGKKLKRGKQTEKNYIKKTGNKALQIHFFR